MKSKWALDSSSSHLRFERSAEPEGAAAGDNAVEAKYIEEKKAK